MKRRHFFLQITFTMFFLLVIECGSNSLSEESTNMPLVFTAKAFTSTPILIGPTHTPIATETPRATSLPTLTFTPLPTLTFTPTLTLTPFPTLLFVEAEALILRLLQDNANCQLSCWWGAIPEQTTWQEVVPLLTTLSAEIFVPEEKLTPPPRSFYQIYIAFPKNTPPSVSVGLFYEVEQEIVKGIEVNLGDSDYYLLPQILATYGEPNEVWLVTYEGVPDDSHPFRMTLIYSQHGFSVSYEIQNIQAQGDNLIACPQQPDKTSLWLVSPERAIKFSDVEAGTLHVGEEPYRQLEEVTNLTTEAFYETFKESNTTNCLETPRALWEY